jgi:hypothetical protein
MAKITRIKVMQIHNLGGGVVYIYLPDETMISYDHGLTWGKLVTNESVYKGNASGDFKIKAKGDNQ